MWVLSVLLFIAFTAFEFCFAFFFLKEPQGHVSSNGE